MTAPAWRLRYTLEYLGNAGEWVPLIEYEGDREAAERALAEAVSAEETETVDLPRPGET